MHARTYIHNSVLHLLNHNSCCVVLIRASLERQAQRELQDQLVRPDLLERTVLTVTHFIVFLC